MAFGMTTIISRMVPAAMSVSIAGLTGA